MDKNNTYKGTFNNEDWYQVTLNGQPFDHAASLKVVNHSPDGFSWGYGGSGPSQLALGILLVELGQDLALEYYMQFKWDVIAKLPQEGFVLTSEQISKWFESRKQNED